MHLVSEDIHEYCLAHSTLPSKVCEEIHGYTREKVPMAQMVSGPLEGSFLGLLLQSIGAKRVLEIGTFTGYSALAMAERLPADGEVVTCDVNPETMRLAQSFWDKSPSGKKIKPMLGPALETLEKVTPGFDFVFIDADKENYLNYLKRALPLLKINGLIAADNTLWSGKVLESNPTDTMTAAIKAFNDWVKAQPDLISTLVPIRDGLLVIRKR